MTDDEFKSAFKSLSNASRGLMLVFLRGLAMGQQGIKPEAVEEPKEFDPELWNDPKYYPHYAKQQKEQTDDNNNKSDQRS